MRGSGRICRRFYSDLDAVALTSRNEGTPLSLIEAMACGRAVVATDVGGVRDLLTQEWAGSLEGRLFSRSPAPRGLLVLAGDSDALALSLIALAENPGLRAMLGDAGREYVFRSHTLSRLFEDLDGVYRRVLAT